MSTYAAVYHGDEYREALLGRHGQQLKLAWKEGYGKDEKKFDPFEEYKIHPDSESSSSSSSSLSLDRKVDQLKTQTVIASAKDFNQTTTTKPKGTDSTDLHQERIFLDDDFGDAKQYKSDGRVVRPASLLASLNAGLPAGGNFAIVDFNGSQQKVTTDDLVVVNKLKPISDWAVGSVHTLADGHVLLVGCSDLTLVGLPGIEGAEVDVMVEEITRDATVLVFKKRRRKHSKRTNGFRREVTFLRVLDIRFPQQFQNVSYEKEKL